MLLRLLVILSTSYLLLLIGPATAATLEHQRSQFLQARKELRAGNISSFNKLTGQLQDYPLYPYLLYEDLSRRFWKSKNAEITGFLKRYVDLPIAGDLRRNWLKSLARRGRWQAYLDNYTPQSDEILQCYFLQARMKRNKSAYLLEDIRSMWLVGESRPPQCDPAFALLYDSELMTAELLWQRIRLAMANGKTSLAGFLSKRLNKNDRLWVSRWIAIHNNPAKWTYKPRYKDTSIAREILIHGVGRLASRDVNKAISRWHSLQVAYSFQTDEINKVERNLALQAARKKHKQAGQLLDRIDDTTVDEDVFHWRIATALSGNDWQDLLKWTVGEPPTPSLRQQQAYWHARALEQTGAVAAAQDFYRLIADERDYYGFLASDRLGRPYNMAHQPFTENRAEWEEIASKPAIARARELHHLGMVYSARREWHQIFNNMSGYQLQIAAAIAADWGWHDRTILTLGKARAYDDLVLRFPVTFPRLFNKYAEKRKLNLSWMYALTRAESAFMVDARSPTGALGLMQVMPATGRQTAKSIGFRTYKNSYLLEAGKNITIGSAYLRQMYEKFDNNIVLATAAYNAGPNAVMAWLPEQGCIEPDIWIEQIPYNETRRYVRRILYFASIYDWRRQQEIKPVQQRMAQIPTRRGLQVAGFTCQGLQVSLTQ